jgi:hypothetical protein
MSRRTIGIMGRLLDQDDGLGVYSQRLVGEILSLDRVTRYVIFLMTEKSRDLFREFPNYVMPARRKLYWDQRRTCARRQARAAPSRGASPLQ